MDGRGLKYFLSEFIVLSWGMEVIDGHWRMVWCFNRGVWQQGWMRSQEVRVMLEKRVPSEGEKEIAQSRCQDFKFFCIFILSIGLGEGWGLYFFVVRL